MKIIIQKILRMSPQQVPHPPASSGSMLSCSMVLWGRGDLIADAKNIEVPESWCDKLLDFGITFYSFCKNVFFKYSNLC